MINMQQQFPVQISYSDIIQYQGLNMMHLPHAYSKKLQQRHYQEMNMQYLPIQVQINDSDIITNLAMWSVDTSPFKSGGDIITKI